MGALYRSDADILRSVIELLAAEVLFGSLPKWTLQCVSPPRGAAYCPESDRVGVVHAQSRMLGSRELKPPACWCAPGDCPGFVYS